MMSRKKVIRGIIFGPLLILLLIGIYLGSLQVLGNFHTVIPDTLYRSAQITAGRLSEYKKQYGIRSIINLRGEKPGAEWYDSELIASDNLGIRHFDFRMSASQILSPQKMEELIGLMRSAPKPVLIHCRSGADRTGLASALYLAGIKGAKEQQAETQLSIRYGHIAIPYLSAAYPMDQSWQNFVSLTPDIGKR